MADVKVIAQDLIRFPSVTPGDHGCFQYVEEILSKSGFKCSTIIFGEGEERVKNLYAEFRAGQGPSICFAGHIDVVPPGELALWRHDPFSATIEDGYLYGRGACDMKSAVAAFLVAASRYAASGATSGAVSLLLTGDEEGVAVNGTQKVLEWLSEQNIKIDYCVVGESTSQVQFGDTIKVGRRGSVTCEVTVHGKQGHVASPDKALNPVTDIVQILHELKDMRLDEGTEHFPPSNLEVVTVDVGNVADNVIPESAFARLNVRFNNLHTAKTLAALCEEVCKKHARGKYDFKWRSTAEAFIVQPGRLARTMEQIIKETLGIEAKFLTNGGTSDARFIQKYAEVMEFGLLAATAHHVDERISVADLVQLEKMYYELIVRMTKNVDRHTLPLGF